MLINCAGCSTRTLPTTTNLKIPDRYLVWEYPSESFGIPIQAYRELKKGNADPFIIATAAILIEKNKKLRKYANNIKAIKKLINDQ